VKIVKPRSTVKCIPGAGADDIESCLKLLAKDKRKLSKIIIHAGGNDSRLPRSEITNLCALMPRTKRFLMSSVNRRFVIFNFFKVSVQAPVSENPPKRYPSLFVRIQ